MKWKIVLIAAAAAVVVAGGVIGLRAALGPPSGLDGGGDRIQQVFDEHEAQLRAMPGLTMLGIYRFADGPPRIVLTFDEVTPEIEAAVPDEIDGYAVEVKEGLPSPPTFAGVVKTIAPATPEQSADGLVGTLTIQGKVYEESHGSVTASPRTLVVNVPSDLKIWRPMGESKEFIQFTDIRTDDSCQVQLRVVPAAQQREVTAVDLEVHGRI